MTGLYLAALLVSIGCELLLDHRLRLFWWRDARSAAITLAAGLAFFLVWDLLGIRLGIFGIGTRPFTASCAMSAAIAVAMKMAVRARSWAMASRCGSVSVGRRWQSLVSSAKATGSALGSMHMIVTFRQNARTPCPGCRSGPSLLPAQPVPASSRGDAVPFSEAVADVA